MDFYLEAKTSEKTRLYFPIIPDRVNVTSGANTVPFNIIKKGEIRIPRGEKATGYSWEGMLPGTSMKGQSFVMEWQAPRKIVKLLETWKKNGTTLLLIVGNLINDDVFIESFNREYFGMGHVKYNITLTRRVELTVTTSPAPTPKKGTGGKSGDEKKNPTGKVTGKSKVKYRSGPGTKYKKLGTLKKGTTVTIYKTKGNWYLIKESPEWWMNGTYVKLSSGGSKKQTTGDKPTRKKQPQKPTTSAGKDGGKEHLTVTIPTSKVNKTSTNARVVVKPSEALKGLTTK